MCHIEECEASGLSVGCSSVVLGDFSKKNWFAAESAVKNNALTIPRSPPEILLRKMRLSLQCLPGSPQSDGSCKIPQCFPRLNFRLLPDLCPLRFPAAKPPVNPKYLLCNSPSKLPAGNSSLCPRGRGHVMNVSCMTQCQFRH